MINMIRNFFHTPKPGDIYIEKDTRYRPNPFDTFNPQRRKIIETRKGWVRFQCLDTYLFVTEWEKYLFLYAYKLETRAAS